MEPLRTWPILGCLLFALPTAALAGPCLPAAAALAAFGWWLAVHGRSTSRRIGLAGLPALLAAWGPPSPPTPPTPIGIVRVQGTVAEVWRNPAAGTVSLRFGPAGGGQWLVVAGDFEVLPGDRIGALARAAAPPVPDLAPRLAAERGNVRVAPAHASLRRAIAGLRRHCERALLTYVPGDAGALLATLVLGNATRPDRDVAAAHRGTGLSHLLAVSGAHAAILAHLLGLSAQRRGQRLRRSRVYTFAVLFLLALYAAVAGGDPPVLRAVLGYTLAALALPLGRRCGLAIGLGVPALVTSVGAPQALLGPSFQLSYAAVLGLALVPPAPARATVPERLRAACLASFWAAAATAPLTLLWFGQLAPWTIVLTPVLAPLVAAMLVGGLAVCALAALLPAAAAGLGWVLAGVGTAYTGVVVGADTLPGTPVLATALPGGLALLLAGTVATSLAAALRSRRGVLLGVLCWCCVFFLPATAPTAARFLLLAVGHGQAGVRLGADGGTVAFDCGSMHHPTLAARRLRQALPSSRLDVLVITHADADHHNGVAALIENVAVAAAVLPAGLANSPVAALLRAHGAELTLLDGGEHCAPAAGVLVQAPRLPLGSSDNDASLWCHVAVDDLTILLTGDAEARGVAAALADGLATPADVLVLPHHGRANPLAPRLLAAVRPQLCLASAAPRDGFTAQGLLARRHGLEVLATGLVGTITLRGGASAAVQHSEPWRPLPAHR